MEILNINFENKTVREYDNMGAHNAAKLMMNKYENLTIQFKTGKDNFQKPEGFFEKTAVHRPDFMIRYMLNDHLEGGNDPWWSLCVLWVSPASAATR